VFRRKAIKPSVSSYQGYYLIVRYFDAFTALTSRFESGWSVIEFIGLPVVPSEFRATAERMSGEAPRHR
jgi:hypothetical protein